MAYFDRLGIIDNNVKPKNEINNKKSVLKHKENESYNYDNENYWKYIQGYKNPYGKKFYDYVEENDIEFHGSNDYVRNAMYDCEYNRRKGGSYKMRAETPTWELGIALLSDLIIGN
jgi:hypothetical protein